MKKLTIQEFINKAKIVHGDKYDYSLVEYLNSRTKVKIICPEHGIFEQKVNNHVNQRNGCPKCSGKHSYNNQEFINKAKLIHGDKYDYSLVDYKNNYTKIKIICSEHGIFEQKPNSHLSKYGCPYCKESKGEKEIAKLLKINNIMFKRQYAFNNYRNIYSLPFDFYLNNYNTCIEYDGEQHYKPNSFFGGIDKFNYIQTNDKIKTKYCIDNGIKLFRIKYNDNIIDSINMILENLKNE